MDITFTYFQNKYMNKALFTSADSVSFDILPINMTDTMLEPNSFHHSQDMALRLWFIMETTPQM